MATNTANTTASFHAKNHFRDRIANDPTLVESCWFDGVEIEAPERDYHIAKVYEGPLCPDVVMFAARAKGGPAREGNDYVIRTVLPANAVNFTHKE